MPQTTKKLPILKRILKEYAAKNKVHIFISLFCSVIMAASSGYSAFLIKPMLDEIFIRQDSSMLFMIPGLVILNAIIKALAYYYKSFCIKIAGQQTSVDLQLSLYKHLVYSDMDNFDKTPPGKFISSFMNDAHAVRTNVIDMLSTFVIDFLTLLTLVGVMVYQSPLLAIFVMIVLPLATYIVLQLGKKMHAVAHNIYSHLSNFTLSLDETFRNISIIKAHCNEEYEISKARTMLNQLLSTYRKAAAISSSTSPLMEIFGNIALVAVIWYGGRQVIAGETSAGTFFSFIASLIMMHRHMRGLSQTNSSLNEGIAASKRIFDILDHQHSITDHNKSVDGNHNFKQIAFKEVSFAYKDRRLVLKDFNITIERGQTVALVGRSGVGKSTVLQLIQRLYSPRSGEIYIGDSEITDIKLSSLRSMISVVSQDAGLFNDTIYNNIRYSKLDATQEEIEQAAKAASAHDFIMNLPDQYATKIGQNGAKISGGQKQRIAIARAFLKQAPILLLDEATSALDSESESEVQKAMQQLMKNKTTIIIAHRLTTIKNADLICFISNGKISEAGKHKELIKNDNLYAKFYNNYNSKND